MKKEKTNPAFLLFSAVLAAVFFCLSSKVFFDYFWGFDLFSSKHWMHILGKWKSGWVLHTTKEYLFFLALAALIPGYFFVWFCTHHFLLQKALFGPVNFYRSRQKKKLEARSLAAATGAFPVHEKSPKREDKAIHISSKKMGLINQLRGKTASLPVSAKKETPEGSSEKAQNKSSEQFDLWDKLAAKLETGNAFVLRRMEIASVSFNLIAITQNALFLICEGPEEGSVWETADEASPAVWKTETGVIPSPVQLLINAKKTIQDYLAQNLSKYPDITVYCCMILDHGHITNMDVLLPFLEKNDLSILKTGTCKTDALPDCDALMELINSQPASSQELNDAVAIAILDLIAV